MKNLTTFLVSFFLINLFTAFQEQPVNFTVASTVRADIVTNTSGESFAIIDQQTLDSLSAVTGFDLSKVNPDIILSENDLKKSLISAIGSFLTMIVFIFLKYFFPDISNKLKNRKK